MLSLGGGYGSEGGIFGVAEVGQNNFRGQAYRVHLKGELGTRDHHTAELSFGTPWILGTPTRLNARIYDNRRFRRYYGTIGALYNRRVGSNYLYDRYVWARRGASLTLGRPIAHDIDLSVRFRNEHVESHNPDRELYNRSTRSILFALGRDTRDYRTSLFDPTAGSFHTLSYEYSGGILGADNKFQKYYADASWFYSGWWNHVIAVHGRAGIMRSKSTDAYFLFYERFFLGGVDSIRGYEDWEIYPDPDESGFINPYGGDKVFFANFEYRVPISQQLTAALFFDIGQVWDESTTNVFNQISMKKGLGLEARFTMLGMLVRLGWGYGLDRVSGEPAGKFHFTVGPGF
jgi:outer membrane protein insertion porin family